MMAVSVDNFVCVRDPMEGVEEYFALAKEACAESLRRCYPEADRIFLRFLVTRLEDLRSTLRSSRAHAEPVLLSLWMQYTPDLPMPTWADLERLREMGFRPQAAMEEVLQATHGWAAIFAELAAHAPTRQASELFEGYRCVLSSWEKHLTSAWQQQMWDIAAPPSIG